MDELIHWPKPYLFLWATWDETLSWIHDCNLDEILICKWQYLQHYKSTIPSKHLQGMTNNIGLIFSVGDTTPQFTISIEQDN